ncbi:MAG: hypothetical protein NWR31_01220 [Cyanobium sp. MAG_160]|nr:hypothetical protein [Cyanobium sp. MAG_160]
MASSERNGSSVKMSLNQQRESRVYEDLSTFERTLARFGDKVSLIAGLELSGKLSPEDAYQQIKALYKDLKDQRKQEKGNWEVN